MLPHEWARGPDRDLVCVEPGYFPGEIGRLRRDSRRTEHLRQCVGLLVGQSKGRSSAVRVGSFIDDDLKVAAAPDDDPDTVPVSNIELET
jgi:hypothetical protein